MTYFLDVTSQKNDRLGVGTATRRLGKSRQEQKLIVLRYLSFDLLNIPNYFEKEKKQ